MVREVLSPHVQEPATLCPMPDMSSPHHPILLLEDSFELFVSSLPRHSKWSLSFWFSSPKTVCTSLPHSCHIPCSSHSSWFHHPNNIWWAVQIM